MFYIIFQKNTFYNTIYTYLLFFRIVDFIISLYYNWLAIKFNIRLYKLILKKKSKVGDYIMIEFQKSDIAIFASVTALAISVVALAVSLFAFKQNKIINSGISGVNSTVNTSVLQESIASESEISSSAPPPVPPFMKRTKTKVLDESKATKFSNPLAITPSKLVGIMLKKRKSTKIVDEPKKNNSLNPHGVTKSTLDTVKLKKVVVKSFTRKKSESDPNSFEGIMAIRRKKLEGENSNLNGQDYVSPIKKGRKPRELSGLAQQVSEKVKVNASNEDSSDDSSVWSEGDSYFQTDDSPKNDGTSVGLYVSNNVEAPKNEMVYSPENNVFVDIIDNNVEVVENNKIDDSENPNYDNLSDEAKESIQVKINKMNLEE